MIKLVVDTNVLFTYFWKNSFTRKKIMKASLELFSPEFALEELNLNKPEILKKTGISRKEFKSLIRELAIAVDFVPLEDYKEFLKHALQISPDPNDIDFFALALKLKANLWSNDYMLKKQSEVEIYSTNDLLNKQEFLDLFFPDE